MWQTPTMLRACAFLASMVASAVSPASEAELIARLAAQVEELTVRLEALEARERSLDAAYVQPVPAAPAPTKAAAADERIRLKGDFRYRHETLQEGDDDDRHRQRIRARLAAIADVTDDVEVGVGLASGGDDPGSTNETLGDGFSSKGIQLDLAYARWATPVEGLALTAGKFKNPFHRAGGEALIWDSDVNPEGVTLAFERGTWFASAVGLWLNEDSGGDDAYVFGVQGGFATALGERSKFRAGTSWFDLGSLRGIEVLFDGDPRGNSVTEDGRYLVGYEELEFFTELEFALDRHTLLFYADYVTNLDAGEFDQGYTVGAVLAGRHRERDWDVSYAYRDLEADAVFALITDSDFIGGGTDGSGHIFQGSYALTQRIALGGTLYVNERGGDAGRAEDFKRLMLDISFRY